MKRAILTAVTLCLVLVTVGCASQRANLRTSTDVYATTLDALARCRRAGRIDDEQAAQEAVNETVARLLSFDPSLAL